MFLQFRRIALCGNDAEVGILEDFNDFTKTGPIGANSLEGNRQGLAHGIGNNPCRVIGLNGGNFRQEIGGL